MPDITWFDEICNLSFQPKGAWPGHICNVRVMTVAGVFHAERCQLVGRFVSAIYTFPETDILLLTGVRQISSLSLLPSSSSIPVVARRYSANCDIGT